MNLGVDCIQSGHGVYISRPDQIVNPFLDISFRAIYRPESVGSIDQNVVRAISKRRPWNVFSLLLLADKAANRSSRTVFLLQLVEPEMTVLLEAMPIRRKQGDLCPERPRVFRQRVEVDTVDHRRDEIGN